MTTEQPGVSAMSAELGGLPAAVATLGSDGHPRHIRHVWGVREAKLYGPPVGLYTAAQMHAHTAQAVAADNELMWRALKALEWTAQPVGVMADEARQVIAALQARLGHPTPALCGPQGPHQQGSAQG